MPAGASLAWIGGNTATDGARAWGHGATIKNGGEDYFDSDNSDADGITYSFFGFDGQRIQQADALDLENNLNRAPYLGVDGGRSSQFGTGETIWDPIEARLNPGTGQVDREMLAVDFDRPVASATVAMTEIVRLGNMLIATIGQVKIYRDGQLLATKTFGVDPDNPMAAYHPIHHKRGWLPDEVEIARQFRPDWYVRFYELQGTEFPEYLDIQLPGESFDRLEFTALSYWNGEVATTVGDTDVTPAYAINSISAVWESTSFNYQVVDTRGTISTADDIFSSTATVTIGQDAPGSVTKQIDNVLTAQDAIPTTLPSGYPGATPLFWKKLDVEGPSGVESDNNAIEGGGSDSADLGAKIGSVGEAGLTFTLTSNPGYGTLYKVSAAGVWTALDATSSTASLKTFLGSDTLYWAATSGTGYPSDDNAVQFTYTATAGTNTTPTGTVQINLDGAPADPPGAGMSAMAMWAEPLSDQDIIALSIDSEDAMVDLAAALHSAPVADAADPALVLGNALADGLIQDPWTLVPGTEPSNIWQSPVAEMLDPSLGPGLDVAIQPWIDPLAPDLAPIAPRPADDSGALA